MVLLLQVSELRSECGVLPPKMSELRLCTMVRRLMEGNGSARCIMFTMKKAVFRSKLISL